MRTSPPMRRVGRAPLATSLPANSPTSARTLVPLTQALASMLAGLAPGPVREVAPADAQSLVLARALRAPAPVPPLARALRAGFAIRASDSFGASPYGPLRLGDVPQWCACGDALPEGCDALAEREAVEVVNGCAWTSESVAPGDGVRRPADDAAEGTILREAGRRMRAVDVAATALASVAVVAVRRPEVALVSAPSTLDAHDPTGTPEAGLIAFLLERHGARTTRLDIADLCADAALQRPVALGALDVGDATPDLVVVFGDPERTRATLPAQARLVADGLALRPGQDAVVARIDQTCIILAPPGVDNALALWLTLMVPLIDRLAGAEPDPPASTAPLTRKVVSRIGLSEIGLLRREGDAVEPLATGDLPLAAISAADFWFALAPGQEGYPAGDQVTVFRLWPAS